MLNLCAKSIANLITYQKKSKIIKGVICGIFLGMIIESSINYIIENQRKVKRKAIKTAHAVGDFIEQMPCMFK